MVNVNPKTPAQFTVRLSSENRTLSEVTVKSKKKSRYSRKDNPAVELMRKVIANKKKSDLKSHDYYRYQSYQKIGLSLNDLKPETLEKGIFKRYPWLREQVETSQYTDKLTLPLTVDEMVTEQLWRKDPKAERTIVKGTKSSGVNDLFQTGEILTTVMRETFADVDIYDDYILLMRHKFSSPIGRDAIQFYRYYITDTVYVGADRCIQLDFLPNNQQDYGFRGQIYIIADTSYQVKRCELYIPRSSDVNWVESMQCMQEFSKQENGEWLLTIDDMIVELMLTDFIQKGVVTRTTRKTDFSFDPLPDSRFKKKNPLQIEPGSDSRSEAFWQEHRQVEFTKSEAGMSGFLTHLEQLKGFKYVIFGLKALIENYLETGTRENSSRRTSTTACASVWVARPRPTSIPTSSPRATWPTARGTTKSITTLNSPTPSPPSSICRRSSPSTTSSSPQSATWLCPATSTASTIKTMSSPHLRYTTSTRCSYTTPSVWPTNSRPLPIGVFPAT